MLGHLASSHTVANPSERTVERSSWYFGEVAGAALSHFGLGNIFAERGGAFLRLMTGSSDVNSWIEESSLFSWDRRLSRRENCASLLVLVVAASFPLWMVCCVILTASAADENGLAACCCCCLQAAIRWLNARRDG